MATVKETLAGLKKEFGKSVIAVGKTELTDVPRIQTGLFTFDLGTGGGFPMGKISTLFGPESSGKTNIALKAIAWHQQMFPDLACAFVDLENSFDPVWAAKLGVDVSKLILSEPDYAEQAVDIIDALVSSEDIGLIVVDSIAGFVTKNEQESSSEKAIVGGSALLVGKMCRKIVGAQGRAAKRKHYPSVICINQTRQKVGIMYGSDETMPGGNALKFFSSMIVRVSGKNVTDSKVSKTKPVFKEIKCVIKKWKMPILTQDFVVSQAMIPHKNLKAGDSNDWTTVSNYLRSYGMITNDKKKGWTILDQTFDTLIECREWYENNKEMASEMRKILVEKILQDDMKGGGVDVSLSEADGEEVP